MNHMKYDKFDDAFRPRAYKASEHRSSDQRPHETTSAPRHSDEPSGSAPSTTTAVSQADGSP